MDNVNNTYIAISGNIQKGFDFHGPYESWDEARAAHDGEFICIEKLNRMAKNRLAVRMEEILSADDK